MEKNKKIAIIGSGGFGRETYYMLKNSSYDCIGFIDKVNKQNKLNLPVIGHESNIKELMANFGFSICSISIGDVLKRENIFEQIRMEELTFPVISDPSAILFSELIGMGSIIYPNVVIMNDCKVGKFSMLNSGVTLGHDVAIGSYCNIYPGVHLAGGITIGNHSSIGLGASIKENINIGNNVIIGAGSVVVKDVADNTTAYGVPANSVK